MKINIKISKGKQSTQYHVDIVKLILELCGGGLTMQQTAKAMELHNKFNSLGVIKINGFKIERVQDNAKI